MTDRTPARPVASALASPQPGPPAAPPAIDAQTLATWLRGSGVPVDGALSLRRVEGGQSNPTYIIDVGRLPVYVLRCKPPGALLPSAHAIEREFRVLRALGGSTVPVPKAWVLCEDPAAIGSAFYVMDFIEGRILSDQTLPGMSSAERRAHHDELNRTMAALHALDPIALGLAGYGKETLYAQRQIERWTRQYRASETQGIAAMDALIDWLPRHVPAQQTTSLVHGDFRLDNVIFHPTEARVVGVLDWELSTLGDPLVDFAHYGMNWRVSMGTRRTLAGLSDAELKSLGIPTEAENVAAYCRRTGREAIEHWEFYLAFNMFRLAAIQQGVARRLLDGNAANSNAAQVAARVQATAEAGWALARSIGQ